MTVLGKFKAFLAGTLPPDAQKVYDDLRAADVPISDAVCRSCPDPCDQGECPRFPFLCSKTELQITTISLAGYLSTWTRTC